MTLTVGIDEVGYGPRLGPLVVAAAFARNPLRAPVPIADSKKLYSPAKGLGGLEPAVLGFLREPTLADLVRRLGAELPDRPWYRASLELPARPAIPGLGGAVAVFLDPAEYNLALDGGKKSDLLFEKVADLIVRIRADHPSPIRFLIGKQGARSYYLPALQRRFSPMVLVREEGKRRSAYEIPGATFEFLQDAEDAHELVALASMIGKYVREGAMRLFNEWWAAEIPGLRPTAGYGDDGTRFFRRIRPHLKRLGIPRDAVLRRR